MTRRLFVLGVVFVYAYTTALFESILTSFESENDFSILHDDGSCVKSYVSLHYKIQFWFCVETNVFI